MKINCIVIDDEYPAIEKIEEFISRVPFLNHLKSFDNAIESIDYIKQNKIDLIFLDIEMEGFTGLQLIKTLQHKPKIILITAYDQYAVEAFDLSVSDYLLKPVTFERFVKSLDKVFNSVSQPVEQSVKKDYFFVKTEFRMQRVDFDDILYVEGMNEYLRIHTLKDRIMTLQKFSNLEESLPPDNFVRVHKSYMVAINKIESIEKDRIKIKDKLIPISKTYRKAFYLMLNKK